MITASFIAVIAATVAIWVLVNSFLKAIRLESPSLYQSWGEPTLGKYLRGRQFVPLLSVMFLTRKYREELRDCPRSRAWGSWLFLAYWVQLAAAAGVLLGLLRRIA